MPTLAGDDTTHRSHRFQATRLDRMLAGWAAAHRPANAHQAGLLAAFFHPIPAPLAAGPGPSDLAGSALGEHHAGDGGWRVGGVGAQSQGRHSCRAGRHTAVSARRGLLHRLARHTPRPYSATGAGQRAAGVRAGLPARTRASFSGSARRRAGRLRGACGRRSGHHRW